MGVVRNTVDEAGVIAFVFPGQGAQYAGMGRELAQLYPEAAETYARADRTLGFPLSAICWEGPDELLRQTENTQPAILATSCAALAVLAARDLTPDVTAGLSLGEYTALVAAGAMTMEEALPLVRSRGRFMQEAAAGRRTAMAAILGLTPEMVREVCRAASTHGTVEPSNFNSPGQIVIAGDEAAVREGITRAKAAGAKRAVLLPVSAPFHTSLMRPAAERLTPLLEALGFREAAVPVVSNVTAQTVRAPREIRDALAAQVASPVRWDDSVRTMAALGVRTFVEVGPGSSLSGLIRKTVAAAKVLRVEDRATLEETLAQVVPEGRHA
ncbi:MAG TPA: ACP S-malonyltransferase [bacterium]|nr:ACP S-malonyltransferase [bacterium]